jgi:hypothetical protein
VCKSPEYGAEGVTQVVEHLSTKCKPKFKLQYRGKKKDLNMYFVRKYVIGQWANEKVYNLCHLQELSTQLMMRYPLG